MYRLQALNADGSTPSGGGVLAEFSQLEVGLPFCDVGSLTFDYAVGGANYALLTDQREVALFDNVGEVSDARFVVEGSNGNRFDADGNTVFRTFSGRNLWKMFEDSVVYGAGYPGITTEDSRPFSASNAGQILSALINKAQTLGDLTGITFTFSGSIDSNGAAWTKIISIEYDVGTPILNVINNLIDQGVCEVRMVGRELRVYNPDTLGTDRTTGATPMVLWSGNGYEVPEQRDSRSLKTVAFVKGDNGKIVEVVDSAAVSTYGRRVMVVSQQGITDLGTLTVIGQAYLDRAKQVRSERTFAYQLDMNAPTALRPMREYSNGDYVFQDVTGVPERVRVRQITITQDGDEAPKVILTLNDRFLEAEVALARKVNGITGGATADGNGGAKPVIDATLDTLAPGQVTGLLATSAAYVDAQGRTWAQVTLDWNALTLNSDGSTMSDLDRYEVFVKRQADTVYYEAASTLNDIVTLDGFLPNSTYNFQVRAIDRIGNGGAFSTVATITTAADTTAPPIPATPVVSDYLGQVNIYWNGLGSAGEAMPTDFKYTEVHISTTSGFTPSAATLLDTLRVAGYALNSDLVYGTAYFVKFVSVDNNGNRSAASAQASATPTRVSGLDIAALAVATSNLADLAVTTAKIGLLQVLNAQIGALAVDDAKIGSVSVGKLTAGTLAANVTVSARIMTASTGARVELNSSGLQAFNSAGVQTVDIAASTGAVAITGAFKTGVAGGGSAYLTMEDSIDRSTIKFVERTGARFAYINSPIGTGGQVGLGINTGNFDIETGNLTGGTQGFARIYLNHLFIQMGFVEADQQANGGEVFLNAGSASLRVAAANAVHTGGEVYVTPTDGTMTINTAGVANTAGRVYISETLAALEFTTAAGAGDQGIIADATNLRTFGTMGSSAGWSAVEGPNVTLSEFRLDKFGGICVIHAFFTVFNAIGAGNIADQTILTVTSSNALPQSQTSLACQWSAGVGAVSMDSGGVVLLRWTAAALAVGDTFRVDGAYWRS